MTSGPGVDERLKRQYDDYYEHGPSEWRRLGALDKASNIVALCGRLPHRSILEIGAGDGSILSRLSELGFGEELHAVEISSSAVEVIQGRAILVPASEQTVAHGTHTKASIWKDELEGFLKQTE